MARGFTYAERMKVLRKTARILRNGWTVGMLAADEDNNWVPVQSENACCFCLDGGVRKACGINGDDSSRLYDAVSKDLTRTLKAQKIKHPADSSYTFDSYVDFNDEQDDVKPVIKLINATIRALKAKQEAR